MSNEQLIWRYGFPPHTGWFNACINPDNATYKNFLWRYYNKELKAWSYPVFNVTKEPIIIRASSKIDPGINARQVRWTWHWPKNARVARINHETGICTGAGPSPWDSRVMLNVGDKLE